MFYNLHYIQTVEFFPKSVQREKLAIVAVDLGSSRSGYTSIAFGMINEMAEGSITKMHLLQDWYTDFMCTTTPKSCLLFDEDQKPRHFGEEAFREYKELERKGKADCWYFFHKYDTYLRDENLTDKTKLCSANGKAMSAGKLFDALIDHLIRHFFRMPQVLLQAEDTKLVFLVPEEPSATVLYMLKNAAVKAGLDKDDVSTVSKQTCMIRYSQMYDLPTKELDGQMPEDFREPGKQFLIVDLGFDQAEVSVHERLEDGRFRDIDIKNLGEWGLKKCITESLEIFPQIFRKDLYREFCDQDPGWFSDVKKEITFKILGASYESTEKVNVTLPGGLRCLYEERTKESMAEAVRNLPKQLNVKLIGDKLRFDKSLFETIVESCITNNITLVRTILTKHRFKRINTIIFFGILLENRRIKKAMVENFDGAVLISSEKGLTASLGAAVISEFLKLERTSEYTYGINICQDFKTEVHTDDHRLRTASGPDICHNIFKRYFMKGEKIYVGERRCGRHSTVFPCQRKMILYILQSKRREPKYANENGIKELDKIVLDLGQDGEGEVAVMMMYTETKLLVEAFDVQKDSEGKDMLNRIYSGRF